MNQLKRFEPPSGFTLPADFAEKNPLPSLSPSGALLLFKMKFLENDQMLTFMANINGGLKAERRKQRSREKKQILSLSTPEEIVDFMDKPLDMASRDLLNQRAVETGGKVYSLILDRLEQMDDQAKSSSPEAARREILLNEEKDNWFIESAFVILSRAGEEDMDRLVQRFPFYRNLYSKIMACFCLAHCKRWDALPQMYDLYLQLKEKGDSNLDSVTYAILLKYKQEE